MGAGIASQAPTFVEDLAGEAGRQPEPCAYWSTLLRGVVRHGCCFITFVFAVPLRISGRDHQVARCLRVLRHVGSGGGGGSGSGTFQGRGGAGGVQKTVEILLVPFVGVFQNQFTDRVSSSCEQRQVSTGVAVLGQGC